MAELVEVLFHPDDRRVWMRPGATLVETAASAGVEIVTGCTRGMCGTDPVRVVAGGEQLNAPEDHERGTIERMGLAVGEFRLACSARLAEPAAGVTLEIETGAF
jgi:nitrite reductase (NADH) large subunit